MSHHFLKNHTWCCKRGFKVKQSVTVLAKFSTVFFVYVGEWWKIILLAFLEIFHYFSIKTSMWNVILYILNTHFTIKIIGSNISYLMYYFLCSLTFMVPLVIFSGQGGQYFWYTLYVKLPNTLYRVCQKTVPTKTVITSFGFRILYCSLHKLIFRIWGVHI